MSAPKNEPKPKTDSGITESKIEAKKRFPNAFSRGWKIAAIIVVVGLIFRTYSDTNSATDKKEVFVKTSAFVPPICNNTQDVTLSTKDRNIEQEVQRGCMSGLIDLPTNIEYEYEFPGEITVYDCSKKYGCQEHFTLEDLHGGRNNQITNFPPSIRLEGKSGRTKFWIPR